MLRSGAICVLVSGFVLGALLLPEEAAALEGGEVSSQDVAGIACGDHEGCHKMQHIVAENERQLQEKDYQLQAKDEEYTRQLQEMDDQLQGAADQEKIGEDSSAGGGASDAYHQTCTSKSHRWRDTKWCSNKCSGSADCHRNCDERCNTDCQCNAGTDPSYHVASAVQQAIDDPPRPPPPPPPRPPPPPPPPPRAAHVASAVQQASDDPGAAARCSNVRANTATAGDLDCVPDQCKCSLASGWKQKKCAICQEYWGGVVECPDGGIGWEGVLMTGTHGQARYCAAWDSEHASLGMQDCTNNKKTCTKLAAGHLHRMTKSAGVLMMKRMKCDDLGCSVFKVGKCFDVGEDVFSDDANTGIPNLADENQQWASLVVSQLKAGTATVCGNTTVDHKIATAGILGY